MTVIINSNSQSHGHGKISQWQLCRTCILNGCLRVSSIHIFVKTGWRLLLISNGSHSGCLSNVSFSSEGINRLVLLFSQYDKPIFCFWDPVVKTPSLLVWNSPLFNYVLELKQLPLASSVDFTITCQRRMLLSPRPDSCCHRVNLKPNCSHFLERCHPVVTGNFDIYWEILHSFWIPRQAAL